MSLAGSARLLVFANAVPLKYSSITGHPEHITGQQTESQGRPRRLQLCAWSFSAATELQIATARTMTSTEPPAQLRERTACDRLSSQ